ncbi:hypothetical protein Tco_0794198 [Tanacetum coccineum]
MRFACGELFFYLIAIPPGNDNASLSVIRRIKNFGYDGERVYLGCSSSPLLSSLTKLLADGGSKYNKSDKAIELGEAKPSHEGYRNTIELPNGNNVVPLRFNAINLWIQNNPRDISKLEKAISLPQDVPSTSDRRLIELKNQVQCLMEAHLAPNPPVQVNKIASSFKICSGPNDTQYCMENREQAFVDYASSRDKKVGREPFTTNQGPRNFNEASNAWKDKPNFNWA